METEDGEYWELWRSRYDADIDRRHAERPDEREIGPVIFRGADIVEDVPTAYSTDDIHAMIDAAIHVHRNEWRCCGHRDVLDCQGYCRFALGGCYEHQMGRAKAMAMWADREQEMGCVGPFSFGGLVSDFIHALESIDGRHNNDNGAALESGTGSECSSDV